MGFLSTETKNSKEIAAFVSVTNKQCPAKARRQKDESAKIREKKKKGVQIKKIIIRNRSRKGTK
jgi:hypothetical protein